MKRWLARARDLERLNREVATLRENVSRMEAALEESERKHGLIEQLLRDREEYDQRLRELSEHLRDAEADRKDEHQRLNLAIRKVQGFVDMQSDQLERTASGLLERIQATRGALGEPRRAAGETGGGRSGAD